ncbi:MAG: hypothetical protein HC866_05630 [Leptolyngbyaceae cyanobacterium RU_5_1]|nr:hypothetical protein [Leptolyngbyaceae cyanobacterium RU_5_1]
MNAQISDHRHIRDQLAQEIQTLSQQKQQQVATAKNLRSEVEELEHYRGELDQYMTYVEAKKQELETGSNPLQKALKQLQEQVSALQKELQQLETQVTVRRSEKEKLNREIAGLKQQQDQRKRPHEDLQTLEHQVSDRKQEKATLERQIVQLQAQTTALRNQSAPSGATQASLPTLNRPSNSPAKSVSSADKSRAAVSKVPQASTATRSSARPDPGSPNGKSAAAVNQPQQDVANSQPSPVAHTDSSEFSQELSELWTDFMVQLPEYEFQTLKAIAHESNPAQVVSKIAKDSLTTPEELIHSINQRAQETLGERVIKPRSGFSPPAIVREHLRTIKKLIETYEYLTE